VLAALKYSAASPPTSGSEPESPQRTGQPHSIASSNGMPNPSYAFRTPPFFQFDSQVSRIFPLHERLNLDLRLEAFNVLNHPDFGSPTATLSSSTFGQTSSTASGNAARVFQGSAKIIF
jgi:hypothetical protein